MAHLPREQVRNDSSSATSISRVHAYVEEALRWLPAQGDTLQGAFLDETPADFSEATDGGATA